MMKSERLKVHPILEVSDKKSFTFFFNDKKCEGKEGEVISSALFANGITVFGHHRKDSAPQGIFCANGQCSQCTVIADGTAVKSCMTPVKEGMKVYSLESLPRLNELPPKELNRMKEGSLPWSEIETRECDVLIIGGGPSGISAGIELGKLNRWVLLVDDKGELGGKLLLQTHTFFGSIADCYAGTRGIDIAKILAEEIAKYPSVQVCLNANALGVFGDSKVGVIQQDKYFMVKPKKLLIATGAREKALAFPGWDLPGVYGAGAFQTLLNRDLVKPSQRLFIVGAGNVGLIAGYHALQANIPVIGIVEALPHVSGYQVHADKIKRLGVPIYLRHTVLRAEGGDGGVKSITIAQIDENFKPIAGTEKRFLVDTVLIAVGLTPISEIFEEAKKLGLDVYSTGDAKEIAEASSAMFGGKITGLQIARDLGENISIPPEWAMKEELLKSRPGEITEPHYPWGEQDIFPVFHCRQTIPCNPCTGVCPRNSIKIYGDPLLGMPHFEGSCTGCMQCVAICPGLAVTVVNYKKAEEGFAHVTLPFELLPERAIQGKTYPGVDLDGNFLHDVEIIRVENRKKADRTLLITVKIPREKAVLLAGIRIMSQDEVKPVREERPETALNKDGGDFIVCCCERVSAEKVREMIRQGVRDMNHLKAALHVGLGACGGKTCGQLIQRLFKEEGISPGEFTPMTYRPMNIEVPLGAFAPIEEAT